MSTILASFVIIALAVAAMAVGVVFGRAPIRGSCGGIAGEGCAACSGQCESRAAEPEKGVAARENEAC